MSDFGTYRGPGAHPMRYVQHVALACERGGCQFSKSSSLLDQARKLVEQTGRNHMSQALWCDQGGHAFSERDPGRQRITVNALNEETGDEETITKDFCGACARQAGLTTKRVTRPPAITADTADGT